MGIQTVSEWLASSATTNPLHNIVIVAVRLAEALARALNYQKLVVEDISNQMNAISDLTALLIKYKSTKVNDEAAPLGKDIDETKSIVAQLTAQGIKDIPAASLLRAGTKPSLISIWEAKLTANKESLSNLSQQESLKLQTFTSRYGQNNDLSSTINQKDTQGKNNITSNLRGN